ncbi:MAG TPA: hypothetical protein VNA67_01675 [Pseudonocardiaceae bacterium]|nr:hypothetical protein [Pseudonocardiaceae bacterium]
MNGRARRRSLTDHPAMQQRLSAVGVRALAQQADVVSVQPGIQSLLAVEVRHPDASHLLGSVGHP